VFDKVNANTSGGDAFFSTSGGWVGFNFKNKAIICKYIITQGNISSPTYAPQI